MTDELKEIAKLNDLLDKQINTLIAFRVQLVSMQNDTTKLVDLLMGVK